MLANYPQVRKWTYVVLWVLGLGLTAAQIYVGATDTVQPTWLTGILAVYPAAAAYVGYQAQSNVVDTTHPEPVRPEPDPGPTDGTSYVSPRPDEPFEDYPTGGAPQPLDYPDPKRDPEAF